MNDLEEIKALLEIINKRLDYLEKEAKFNHNTWEENGSCTHDLKRWGGFYLAGLLAEETLGMNGGNSIFGRNQK